jgi:hypothetical protein
MNRSEVKHFEERLTGIVKDFQFDLSFEKDDETKRYLTNTIRHLQNCLEVFNRIESKED